MIGLICRPMCVCARVKVALGDFIDLSQLFNRLLLS